MSVFSGVMPVFNVVRNSDINVATKGLLGNLLVAGVSNSGVGVAVNKALGAEVASQLGLLPKNGSNFVSQIVTPGLISTGIGGLSQTLATSIRNSQALGPLGPLAGNLLDAGLNYASKELTNKLSGLVGAGGDSKGTLYFPGAGGEGEGEANFPGNSTYPGKKNLHAISGPNGDVVFSLVLVKDLAQLEAYNNTVNNPNPPQGTQPAPKETPAASSGADKTGGVPAGTPQAPAATATTGDKPKLGSEAAFKDFNNSRNAGATTATATPTTPTDVARAANNAVVTQPSGTNQGNPAAPSDAPPTTGQTPPAKEQKAEAPSVVSWKFICPPEEISWETTFQAERVPIFGMNEAPVIGGVKGMRDLTLSNAIVEGFSRGKTVEDKIALLERALNMENPQLPSGGSFIQIPVYRVYAGGKFYGRGVPSSEGDEGGYFVIKSLKVQEKMRDFSGRTTRAMVDISLIQVPSYQVLTGRDIASPFLPSQKSVLGTISENQRAAAEQLVKDVAAAQADQKVRGGGGGGGGGSGNGGGSGSGGGEQIRALDPAQPGGGPGTPPRVPNGR